MNEELDAHLSELLSYINLLDNAQFSGKDANKVLSLKKYLGDILIQVMEFKNNQSIEIESK